MEKIKLNIFQVCILILLFAISCTNDKTDELTEKAVIGSLNTLENRQFIKDVFTEGTDLNNQLKTFSESQEFNRESEYQDIDQIIAEYEECTDCPSEYKNFLIPFFQEMKHLNLENEILSKIQDYELRLEDTDFDELIKDNLRFTLFSFKEATKYVIDNYELTNDTLRSGGCGRALGQGLVSGFAVGCVRGGLTGAAGGTVALPGVGTVTGAVGGCIVGGAVGGVITGFTSWLWCAIK